MNPASGRVLALDLGAVRVGLAISDPLGITAQPLGVIPREGRAKLVLRVRGLIEEHGAARILVGHPLLLSGEAGEKARDAEDIAAALRDAVGLPVRLWDERLSTRQAERALLEGNVRRERRRGSVDAMAAALILQSFLDATGGTPSEDGYFSSSR